LQVQTGQLETARMQLDVINQSVTYLAGIERNTRYNSELVLIKDELISMNTYLKNI
jgi:hypothetical protein